MFEKLTRFLPELESRTQGEQREKAEGALDDAIMAFIEEHKGMRLQQYGTIIEKAGIKHNPMKYRGISELDGVTVAAVLVWAMRCDRFSPGAFHGFCEDGSIVKCLKRLKEIDQEDCRYEKI